VEWRREQLDTLLTMLEEREADLLAALAADLGKSSAEGYATEVAFLKRDARDALTHFDK
jgi:aldehyde dehydrogenase (NAD+)